MKNPIEKLDKNVQIEMISALYRKNSKQAEKTLEVLAGKNGTGKGDAAIIELVKDIPEVDLARSFSNFDLSSPSILIYLLDPEKIANILARQILDWEEIQIDENKEPRGNKQDEVDSKARSIVIEKLDEIINYIFYVLEGQGTVERKEKVLKALAENELAWRYVELAFLGWVPAILENSDIPDNNDSEVLFLFDTDSGESIQNKLFAVIRSIDQNIAEKILEAYNAGNLKMSDAGIGKAINKLEELKKEVYVFFNEEDRKAAQLEDVEDHFVRLF